MTHTQTQGADGAGTKTGLTMVLLPMDDPRRPLPYSDLPPAMIRAGGDAFHRLKRDRSLDADSCSLAVGIYRAMTEAHAREIATLSPAPAATPGVPYWPGLQLRAALEAAEKCRALFSEIENDYSDPTYECRQGCEVADAAIEHLSAAIAAQPAGQAGDAGANPVRAALEASMEARGANRQQAFFREAAARIAPNSTRTSVIAPGPYEDATEFVQEIFNIARARANMDPEVSHLLQSMEDQRAFCLMKASEGQEDKNEVSPEHYAGQALAWKDAVRMLRNAPNSTRTGAGEELNRRAAEMIQQCFARAEMPEEISKGTLRAAAFLIGDLEAVIYAARPEAPSDAGWSREDLEAFVAREWPEGRSAGAAARELVRALGVRGLAPTLQRLLTDLLGQINFASTDRAQILADFANAAPEAARMAKIDSFERWNPRVFDPTPPSDPAPSGQAEG
jgi:hypothetical protein